MQQGRHGRRHRSRIRACRTEPRAGLGRCYDRLRDLPRLLPVIVDSVTADTPDGRAELLALLGRALRAERVRARGGHWTYDPGRHAALLRAYRLERAAFLEMISRQRQHPLRCICRRCRRYA